MHNENGGYGKGYSEGIDAKPVRGDVSRQLDRLGKLLGQLGKDVDDLHNRLQPILSPRNKGVSPQPPGVKMPEGPESMLAEEVAKNCEVVLSITTHVTALNREVGL